jgi:hypothetical protein
MSELRYPNENREYRAARYLGGRKERFFISGELNCRRIMSTQCGRIGISWTLRQRVGQTLPLRHKISGPNSWKTTI